ncbi:serine/threonine-protein phosphatase PP2A 65 kDa regulatory subunit-like isoform X2 [Anthonomus grandis grandis]|uniref:serine/threonine-protein phosphatase PP2A 65 kDa regulatory subunit-like isoform X2 n=1 Tax=Anthonomus grandis grandis TaxID=2921223 RepID=UPI00216515BA|nr:serine/threonine-protein phosphatase PP2A 65 kDa regulatory subunit-like isoform X2 [Anthonomus grandis grandis]
MWENSLPAQDFQLFKEALIEENLEIQVAIIKRFESLAKALGEKITREELLPFVELHFIELHDEILFHLAVQLKSFIPLVGGVEHCQIVFDILSKLCITDENIVREKAVESLIWIQEDLNGQEVERYIFPVIIRLIKDDWFTSKCSAVMVFSHIYSKLSNDRKSELRNNFKMLIQDDSPMVRKAASMACVKMCDVVEDGSLKSEFVPIFKDIAQDPMDSVRAGTIEIALALIKRLGSECLEEVIFKIIEEASDKSWKIRQQLAKNLSHLQDSIPYPKYRGKLIALFQKLAKDIEAEVRLPMVNNLFNYCNSLKESYLRHPQHDNNFEPVFQHSIMNVIQSLALDDCEEVRLALAYNILHLREVVSQDCFKTYLISFLLQIMESDESNEVQSEILSGLTSLYLNIDLMPFLGVIKNSLRHVIARSRTNWRARRSLLKTFINVANCCTPEYFSEHFKIYFASLLGDSVYAVRRSACMVVPILTKRFGIKWAAEHLVPFFAVFAMDSRYLYRFVALFGISEMVISSLCPKPINILDGFKCFIEQTDHVRYFQALRTLVKVVQTNHLVQLKMKESNFDSMLSLRNKLDYLPHSDLKMYSEQSSDEIPRVNIYFIEENDLQNNHWPYVQGILYLIYNKFLPIIEKLNNDYTENVQLKAISALNEIAEFLQKLEEEEKQEWVQRSIQSLSNEEISVIIEEVHLELKNVQFENNVDLLDEIK